MRASRTVGWTVAIVFLLAAPLLAAPPEKGPFPPKPGANLFRSERYALSVKGPAGWTKEFEGAKAVGTWIDLVSFREPKTRAFLKVSCQASTYAGFDEMQKKLSAHYGGLGDLTILRGPERVPPVMSVRGPGLYIEFARSSGSRTDRSFLAYYLNGQSTVRIWGTVAEKKHRNVETAFTGFLGSLRFFSRFVTSEKPNFVHEPGRCALVFPEGWTVQIPGKGPIASFRGERLGVKIWLHREKWTDGLAAYGTRRLSVLNAQKADNIEAAEPRAHEKRGDPVLVLTYDKGTGRGAQRYREVCLEHGGHIYRLSLGGSPTAFDRGLPALEKMLETLRFR